MNEALAFVRSILYRTVNLGAWVKCQLIMRRDQQKWMRTIGAIAIRNASFWCVESFWCMNCAKKQYVATDWL
jgi:type IV secretory pathway VirB3-like protein